MDSRSKDQIRSDNERLLAEANLKAVVSYDDLRALALSLAEALESAKPVYANALQVAIDMMRSGEPWSDAMADKMRAVVSEWCERANAALASPALVKLKGGE